MLEEPIQTLTQRHAWAGTDQPTSTGTLPRPRTASVSSPRACLMGIQLRVYVGPFPNCSLLTMDPMEEGLDQPGLWMFLLGRGGEADKGGRQCKDDMLVAPEEVTEKGETLSLSKRGNQRNSLSSEQGWRDASPSLAGTVGRHHHTGAIEETPSDLKGHVRVKAA